MGGYVLKRILVTIPTLIGISIVIFFMVRLLPGDIVDVLLGGDQAATEEQKQQTREQLGLTGSYPEQYWRWISNFVQGDLGFSYRNTQPVSEILVNALPITLELVAPRAPDRRRDRPAARRPLGRQARQRARLRRPRGRPDRRLDPQLLARDAAARSSPRACFGWVPPLTYTPIYEDPIENLSQFILPAISISVFTLAIVMRMVRATMLEVLGQDYVRTARAKGRASARS